MKVLYTASGSASGGREGQAETSDKKVTVALSTPKELGGGGGPGTNPEQLFAIGYSACFLGALKFVAGQDKKRLSDESRVAADVGIGPRDDGKGFGLTVKLTVSLPGQSAAEAQDLVDRAHIVCPYSHATRGNITVETAIA